MSAGKVLAKGYILATNTRPEHKVTRPASSTYITGKLQKKPQKALLFACISRGCKIQNETRKSALKHHILQVPIFSSRGSCHTGYCPRR